ncbi:MAG TPA: aldose epimerase family protein [Chryseosolibacter sp.]|jgi:Galactose mutarotase and related enzymes
MQTRLSVLLFLLYLMTNCSSQSENKSQESDVAEVSAKGVTVSPFGNLSEGQPVSLYTMNNGKGSVMKVMNYGGIIVSLQVPDRDGNPIDVILGFDSLKAYEAGNPFFGSLVGRYGNRIAKGKFVLDGKEYDLIKNNNGNHLHGGTKGFDKVMWKIEEVPGDEVGLKLSYLSKDMEEGYPGNLHVEVVYTLTEDHTVKFDYKATTDKKTIVNLTQHTYFNLNGGKTDILSHEIAIHADKFIPVDEGLIPTGEIRSVENTPFDFRVAKEIGEDIDANDQQIKFGKGFDHSWVINGEGLKLTAQAYDSISGIEMSVHTTEPGVQFYTGNFLDGSLKGKNDVVYKQRTGFCLETQHFPDSPNQKNFPSVILKPGETYSSQTTYHFSSR